MIDSVTIHHDTVIDRGLHDSEGVRVEQAQNTLLLMGISYAGFKEGYNYRANLAAGDQSHVLRYIYSMTGEPILMPEINRLVDTFTSAGWQANTSTQQTQPDFGITQIKTEIKLTPDADARSATTICASFIAAVVTEAHARLESEYQAKTQAMADSHTCTITQQVIWSIADEDWKLTAEHISQEVS